MTSNHPNFLFIMTDQLAAPALPFYGNPVGKTPHLTAIANNGVLFENAYCNSPLCAPSRASMMTGQLPSRIGTYDNAAEFPAEIPTFAHYLRAMGYQTCLCGKMHFIGPDQFHGFEERLTTDIYPADFCWTPDWTRPEARPSGPGLRPRSPRFRIRPFRIRHSRRRMSTDSVPGSKSISASPASSWRSTAAHLTSRS